MHRYRVVPEFFKVLAIALLFAAPGKCEECEDESFVRAVESWDADSVNKILGEGKPDQDCLDFALFTAIKMSGGKSNPTITALLQAGSDPSAGFEYITYGEHQDVDDYTALHFAAAGGWHDLVEEMLGYVDDPATSTNVQDSRGYTPLHSAARCDFRLSCDDSPPCVGENISAKKTMEVLIKFGADKTVEDVDGDTPLDIMAIPDGDDFPDPPQDLPIDEWPTGTCPRSWFYLSENDPPADTTDDPPADTTDE